MDDSSSATELAKKLNVLHALNCIATSWKAVPEETIVKCFSRCGFIWSDQEGDVSTPQNVQEYVQALLETATSLGIETDMDSEEYANVEAGLPTESLDGWEGALGEEYQEALHCSTNPFNTVAEERGKKQMERMKLLLHVAAEKS